jgi:chromosomal replication initiation ATPase DnaA
MVNMSRKETRLAKTMSLLIIDLTKAIQDLAELMASIDKGRFAKRPTVTKSPPVVQDFVDKVMIIKTAVCHVCKVTMDEIDGETKPQRITEARAIAMGLCCHLSDDGVTEIGRRFGKEGHPKNHVTVIRARDKLNDMCEQNPGFKSKFLACEALAKSRLPQEKPDWSI